MPRRDIAGKRQRCAMNLPDEDYRVEVESGATAHAVYCIIGGLIVFLFIVLAVALYVAAG